MAAGHFPLQILDVARWSVGAVERRRTQRCRGKCLMAGVSLYGFFDESGDVRKDNRLFICGYLGWGTLQEDGPLDEFVKRWGAATVGIGSIHATEMLSQSGDFFGWDADRVDRVTEEL